MTTALVLASTGAMTLESRVAREPGIGEVSLAVIATGICGSDVHGASGHTGRRQVGQVMGHETVGRVQKVGRNVSRDWLGATVAVDPVISCGACGVCAAGAQQHCERGWVLGVRSDVDAGYATDLVVPARNLVPVTPGMPAWHGAVVEPLAVGYHAAVRGDARPDDRVLILGGGPIGQAVALGCRRLGVSRVVVSEPDEQRGDLIERLGFHRTHPGQLDGAIESVLGGEASLVFDVVGIDATIATALEKSAPLARVVLVGMDSPQLSVQAYRMSSGERTLIGTICSTRANFAATMEWVAENGDIVDLIVDRRAALEDGPEIFADLMAGTMKANKILLMPELDREQEAAATAAAVEHA